jgi:hypothetical protein
MLGFVRMGLAGWGSGRLGSGIWGFVRMGLPGWILAGEEGLEDCVLVDWVWKGCVLVDWVCKGWVLAG